MTITRLAEVLFGANQIAHKPIKKERESILLDLLAQKSEFE